MIKETIKINSSISWLEIIRHLEKKFLNWEFNNMGTVKSIRNSQHYHIRSKQKNGKGILELTLSPVLGHKLVAKIADNRDGAWARSALKELKTFLILPK